MHSASRVLHSAPRQPTRLLRTALPKSALDILTIQRQKRTSSGPKRNPTSPQAKPVGSTASPTFAPCRVLLPRLADVPKVTRSPTRANVIYPFASPPAVGASWHVASVLPRRPAGWNALAAQTPISKSLTATTGKALKVDLTQPWDQAIATVAAAGNRKKRRTHKGNFACSKPRRKR